MLSWTIELPATWVAVGGFTGVLLAVSLLLFVAMPRPERKEAKSDGLLGWLGLHWSPQDADPKFGRFLGWILKLSIPALFTAALVAAFAVLGKTIWDVFVGGGTGPSLGVGAMITALLGVPFVIWGTVIRQKALEFQKEGHITDRISAAVEQLGAEKVVKRQLTDSHGIKLFENMPDGNGNFVPDPQRPIFIEETAANIEVRIGGLLSLERIAQDSTRYDQGRDHVRVMEIICAYVRENAPKGDAKDFPLPEWESLKDDPTEEERQTHNMWFNTRFADLWNSFEGTGVFNAVQWARSLAPPREDIQTALNILKRRTSEQRKVEANWPDVGPAPEGWLFDEANFERLPNTPSENALTKDELKNFALGLDVWKTCILAYEGYRLDLRNTNLQGADLSKAVFSGALLNDARMEGANLNAARMEGANLREAQMEGANLGWARMEGAYLREARMEGAYLREARMEAADLRAARMEAADLGGARIQGADLDWARMEVTDLDWAHFGNETSFQRGSFQAACWRNVSLLKARLTQEQIDASFGDGSVILPEELNRPAHWPEQDLNFLAYNDAYENWLKTRSP